MIFFKSLCLENGLVYSTQKRISYGHKNFLGKKRSEFQKNNPQRTVFYSKAYNFLNFKKKNLRQAHQRQVIELKKPSRFQKLGKSELAPIQQKSP